MESGAGRVFHARGAGTLSSRQAPLPSCEYRDDSRPVHTHSYTLNSNKRGWHENTKTFVQICHTQGLFLITDNCTVKYTFFFSDLNMWTIHNIASERLGDKRGELVVLFE